MKFKALLCLIAFVPSDSNHATLGYSQGEKRDYDYVDHTQQLRISSPFKDPTDPSNLFSAEKCKMFQFQTTPSQRTPSTNTNLNSADMIERYLQRDNHQTWGFVIYRCTYEKDSEWEQFMVRLRYAVERALQVYNGLDILNSLSITVFTDKNTLDGASKSAIREKFKLWTETAPQQEQGTGPAQSQRYKFCIHVDAEVLESVLEDPVPDPLESFVNIISKDWDPNSSAADEDEEEEDEEEEELEPIEGSTLQDVGWMKVAFSSVMVDFYRLLRDSDDWYREYRRPPQIVHA